MKDEMGLSQIIYNVLKTQIQFGGYRFGDVLPTMEEASSNFFVALATVRSAYLRLQKEGYISLSPNKGSIVIKKYTDGELEACIQDFFSQRKTALIDLSKSIRPLLGHAQWLGLRHAPSGIFSDMLLFKDRDELQPYLAFNHITRAYESLGNELLLRLLWQIFMFFEAPFFGVPQNSLRIFALREYAPLTLDYCLRQDWNPLQKAIWDAQDYFSATLCQFYEDRITAPAPQQELAFTWHPYEKASQICYSLAMDLLIPISTGQYAANTLLPSLDKMSKERQVSVSTVRRALSLLNGVGATKSVKRIGTRVLPFEETVENCDFTKPVVRKRLLGLAESLQLLTISCRETATITISALDRATLRECKEHLSYLKDSRQYGLVSYTMLDIIRQHAPYMAIRTVYAGLMQQLLWGHPLRVLWRTDEGRRKLHISCCEAFIRSLEEGDAGSFSAKLEELMLNELEFTVSHLVQLGVSEAQRLLIDGLCIVPKDM